MEERSRRSFARLRAPLLGAAALAALLGSRPCLAEVATSHLSSDAAAAALIEAGGGYRFAAEMLEWDKKEGKLALRPRAVRAPEDPAVEIKLKNWRNGVASPFLLTFDGASGATMTVTSHPKKYVVTNLPAFPIAHDFNELFVRTEASLLGARVTVSSLALNGVAIPDTSSALDGGSGALDLLRIRGGSLATGFVLTGSITLTWPGSSRPNGSQLGVQIWGARVVAAADSTAPQVSILSPAAGSLLATASPEVAASYSDSGSGIDPASVRLLLDGFDATAQATVGAGGLGVPGLAALGEGAHTLAVTVRDRAGNEGRAEVLFTTDTAGPEIGFSAPLASVLDNPSPAIVLTFADGVSGSDPATLTVSVDGRDVTSSCSAGTSGATCSTPPLASGAHNLAVRLRDRAGNLTSAGDAFSLDLDDVAPELAVVEPAEATIVGRSALRLRLAFGDARSGIDPSSFRVALDGQDVTASCALAPAVADCPPPTLARGAHLLTARLSDLRGNTATAQAAFRLALPLEVAFTAPEAESFSTAPVVRLEGTVSAEAATVRVNGLDAVVQAGTFAIEAFPLRDGLNNLVAVAEDGAGNTGTATLRLEADRTPPRLSVSSPLDGAIVVKPEVSVLGRVNDLITGTVGETEVSVTVNGVAAAVAQRGFLASDVPLAPGPNTLEIVATDRGGNRTAQVLSVIYAPPSAVRSLRVASGDGQTGPIGARPEEPLVVAVSDEAGVPAAGVRVVFRVVGGSGRLENGRRAQAVTTGASGLAAVRLTLGSRAGAATDRVRAAAAGYAGEAEFAASATPGPAAALDVAMGDAQVGALGTPLALPLVALLTDGQQNPIVGAPVTFRSVGGGGRFPDSSAVIEILTDESGLATVPFELGSAEGWDAYRVEARFAGMTVPPAVFRASGFLAQNPAATRISGVVLDNEDRPVPGVTMRLRGSAATSVSDAAGKFTLAGVPLGQVFLIADASTTTRSGAWPNLEFELFAVAGLDNTLPKPIYLLPLDLSRGVVVDETRGGRVTIAELPGFALDLAPGSVTFPGGSRSGLVSVTPVHADKVPMAPGSGMQPRLIVTIQPAGARFDPPAVLTLPNVDALPPGTVTEMFSFDHDIGAFVSIGTGIVSEDGRVLRSDPGFGVVEAGWHCGARQSPSGASASLSLSIAESQREPVVFLLDDGGGAALRKAAGVGVLTALGQPATDSAYAWTVAHPEILSLFPGGEPICQESEVCRTEVRPKSVGATLATAKLTCATTGRAISREIGVVVAKVRLKEVSFSGATYRAVAEDGSGTLYNAPHWQDDSIPLDGDASDLGERRFPVSYVQNGKIAVSATWTLEPPVTPGAGVQVRGEVSSPEGLGLTIPPTAATVSGGLVSLGATEMTGQLPPGIGFLNPLRIDWEMSTDGGNSWTRAGSSDNRVYVVLRRPSETIVPYETLFDIGCRNAAGKLDDASAVDAIWLDFKDPIPGVKRKQRDGNNFLDGKEMSYWVDENSPQALLDRVSNQCQTIAGMLLPRLDPNESALDGLGTCRAWADALLGTLGALGISGSLVEVTALEPSAPFPKDPPGKNRKHAELLVKKWDLLSLLQPAPAVCGGFGVLLFNPEGPDLRLAGVPAQGISNPLSNFTNHFIVSIGGAYYDPSYGAGPFSGSTDQEARIKWEDSSLDGFWWYCTKGNTGHVARPKALRRSETSFAIRTNP